MSSATDTDKCVRQGCWYQKESLPEHRMVGSRVNWLRLRAHYFLGIDAIICKGCSELGHISNK